MPPKKSSSSSSGSRTTSSSGPRSAPRFIPNLKQINEAANELPDPDIWPEATFECPLEVEGKQRSIEFKLKSITRGKKQTSRWIYEGKVLIRKRDV